MSAISIATEHIQQCSGPDDPKWFPAWLRLIRLVETQKAGEDATPEEIEVRIRERFIETFGARVEMPGDAA